jgi:hypothetical protein
MVFSKNMLPKIRYKYYISADIKLKSGGGKRMYKIVLIRHGESTWEQRNRFTGWTDVIYPKKEYRKP